MNQLIPCPGCHRHVRQAETSCPFCSAALSFADAPAPVLPRTRLGRAATFAFGATLVGATALVACGGESEDGKKGGGAGSAAGGTTGKAGAASGGSSAGQAGAASGGSSAGQAGAASGGSSAGNQPIGGTGIGPVYGAPAGGTGNGDVGGNGGAATAGAGTGGSGAPGTVYGAPTAGFSAVPLYGAAPAD
jgi:hypothetical protein